MPTPTPAPRVLTICLGSEPETLEPYQATGYAAQVILEAIYDGPVDTRGYELQPVIVEKLPSLAGGDAELAAVPVQEGDLVVTDGGDVAPLAEGLRVRPAGCRAADCAVAYTGQTLDMDQLSATFRLLPGLKWSDGTPLTAADSAWAFEAAQALDEAGAARQQESATVQAGYLAARTAAYRVLDEQTVRWLGVPGWLDPAYQASFFAPLPRHRSPADTAVDQDSSSLPLGWGPYLLEEWVPGERIIAERNPHYFRAAEGLPYFDRLVFRFVGQDADRSLAALQAGLCDVVTADALSSVDLDRLAALESAGALRVYAGSVTTWEHLDYCIDPAAGYERPDYFQDARLRQAIAHCLDRQLLADEVYGGYASIMSTYLPDGHPLLATADVAEYAFDRSRAAALLDELGWRDADSNGVREAHGVTGIEDGTPLAVRYQAPASGARTALAGRIAADLAACGVGVTLSLPSPPQFFAGGEQGLLYGRRFDLAEQAWLVSGASQCKLFLSTAIPSQANGWTGSNVMGYVNPAYDAACRAALAALPGTDEYATAHGQALLLFAQDLPVLPLLVRHQLSAARPDLAGYRPDPGEPAETWNVEEFRIEP